MNPFSETPVVMQALPRWDGAYASTALKVAQELSRDRIVFYVDHPFTWKDLVNKDLAPQVNTRKALWENKEYSHHPFKEFPNFINICPKAVPSINFMPEGAVYEQCRKYNNYKVWQFINAVLDKYGISEFIYINSFDPVYSKVATDKRVALSVYHCVDHIPGERYIAKHGITSEIEFAKAADITISTSKPLMQRLRQWNPNSYTVENAADYELFSSVPSDNIPKDIASIPHPRVLYMGNIGLRIDYNLLEKVALELPDYHFVMAGPINKREFKGERLKKLNNVYFLGRKDYKEVPAYINAADVCLIPFVCTEYTKYIYPLKINEYLSLGKPVVCSNFANLDSFDHLVSRYNTPEEFIQELQRAYQTDTAVDASKRKVFAAENTWDKRMERWREILQRACTPTTKG